MTGSLLGPLARMKVDEKNCFGMIEWQAVREAASRQQKRGNTGTFPLLNRKGSRQYRRIEVQSKETLMAPGVQPGLGHGVAAEARGSIAARQAAGTLPWIGVNDSAEEQRLQAYHAARLQESANFQHGGPAKLTGAHDPRYALQKNGGLADQWYMDDGDIMCHPILVLPFLQDFDVANAKVGAERNPLKTEVIYCVNDLVAAPLEWKIGDVRSLATTSAVTAGSITLGVAVESRQFITDPLLSEADVVRTKHEGVQLCQNPQTEFVLLRESLGVSRINHNLRVHGHKILEEQWVAAVYDEIGQQSLERLFPGFTEDSATLSAGQSGIGFKGALIAAKPQIQGMIRDAVRAGLLPEQILETRLSEVIETATSTYLSELDNDEQATARLYFEGSPGGRRSLAANCLGTAGTGCHKPDQYAAPGTSQLRLPR